MTSLDVGLQTLRSAAYRVNLAWDRLGKTIKRFMPTGLYARALLIIIAPMVVLQSVVAFVFMERHWNSVTQKLSSAVVSDIAALIDVYRGYPQDGQHVQIRRIAQERLGRVGGREYVGRVVLRGEAGAGPVEVSLVWGGGASERQTVAIARAALL